MLGRAYATLFPPGGFQLAFGEQGNVPNPRDWAQKRFATAESVYATDSQRSSVRAIARVSAAVLAIAVTTTLILSHTR